jgi:hypothetical protein
MTSSSCSPPAWKRSSSSLVTANKNDGPLSQNDNGRTGAHASRLADRAPAFTVARAHRWSADSGGLCVDRLIMSMPIRMSFSRGSLVWPPDVSTLPLIIRHDSRRPAGKILDLHYDRDGRLCIKAQVDDSEARRMQGFSVSVRVWKSTVHNAESGCFYAVIEKAVIDEISLTPIPANSCALVLSRRDVAPIDDHSSTDAIIAALERFKKGIEVFVKSTHITPPSAQAPETAPAQFDIGPAPGLILVTFPSAILRRKRSPFSDLVARLPIGEHHHA